MCASSSSAAIKINFVASGDVDKTEVSFDVYESCTTNLTPASIDELTPVTAEGDGTYKFNTAGTYSYHVRGSGYYGVYKIFNVTSAEATASPDTSKDMVIETGKIAGNGFEPCNPNLADVPTTYAKNYEQVLGVWTNEILNKFSTDSLVEYSAFTTPAFTSTLKKHEFTSQVAMMSFLNTSVAANPNMHLFSLGKTANYKFDMPIVVFTSSTVPSGAKFDDVAKIIRNNGKLNVWYQAQIHPNEPASGEAALAMIKEMAGAYGTEVLKKINLIVIPRMNPDGSYLFTRATYGGFDMNRDHMRIQAVELDYVHRAFTKVMPEVAIDGHEFTYYGVTSDDKGFYMRNAYDIEATPASSLNNDISVNAFAMNKVSVNLHKALKDAGLRNYHYGYTVNNPIGRAYYGLFNSISVLVETRGIRAGRQNFERRVFSQFTAAKSIINTSVASAGEIRTMVADARAKVVAKGAKYDADDNVVLYQTASGSTKTAYVCDMAQFYMDGSERAVSKDVADNMNDTVLRNRVRPTAYILPKDMPSLDVALSILDSQGAEYYEIAPGTAASADQYYYVGTYTNPNTAKVVGFEAGLRPEAKVTFSKGAIVIPMDQVAGNVIAMLLEPDVNDSNGYNGTFVQSKIVTYDPTSKNFPYYRYTIDNPRSSLPAPSTPGGSSSGGCNAGFAVLLLILVVPTVMKNRKSA